MRVRIGHMADLHLGAGTAFGAYDAATGLNTFTLEQINAAKAAIDAFSTAGCQYLLIVGDVFDYPNPSMVLNYAFQALVDYAVDKGMIVLVKTGNHEKENDQTDALLALHRESDINYQYIGHGRTYITPERVVFSDQDVEHPEADYHIGLYHGIIEGALAGGFALKAPPVKVAKSVKLLLLGDVHMAQQGKFDGRDYFYPGSPVRLNFGEKDYDPSVGICTIDTHGWTYTYERVSTVSHSRQFVELTASDIDAADLCGADVCAPRSIVKVTGPAVLRRKAAEMVASAGGMLYRYIELSDEVEHAELPKSNEFNVRKVIAGLPVAPAVREYLASLTTEEEFTGLTGEWRLDEITAVGFGSYGQTAIQFPITDSSILVVGKVGESEINSNGAGKSLIFDAIKTCLYGTTYRGLATGWIVNGPKATLTLKLTHGAHSVFVKRDIEKGTGAGKQTLRVWIDNVEQTQDRIGDTQSYIARLLGVSDQTFEICTMIGQQGLSLVDKTSAFRVDYMVDLFKMGDVDTIADSIKASSDLIVARLDQAKRDYDAARARMAALLASPAPVTLDPFATLAMESKKQEASEAIGALRAQLSGFMTANANVDAWNNQLAQAVATAKRAVDAAKYAHDEAVRLEEAATTALNDGVLWRDKPGRTCPKCGNVMDDAHAAAHLDFLNGEVTAASVREEETSRVYEAALRTYDGAVNAQTKEAKVRAGVAEQEAIMSKIGSWQAVIDDMTSQLAEVARRTTAYATWNAACQTTAAQADEQEIFVTDLQGHAAYWAYVRKHFNASAIKEQVVNTVKTFLNDTASYYLSRIFGAAVGVQCDVGIQHTKAKSILKFEIYVLRDGTKVPFEQYSKGERGAVRVAIDLAVSQLVSSVCPAQFRFLILDEAMDGLDQAKSEAIAELIKELVQTRGTAFVVTHKLKIATKFDHTIRVEKIGNTSQATLI